MHTICQKFQTFIFHSSSSNASLNKGPAGREASGFTKPLTLVMGFTIVSGQRHRPHACRSKQTIIVNNVMIPLNLYGVWVEKNFRCNKVPCHLVMDIMAGKLKLLSLFTFETLKNGW